MLGLLNQNKNGLLHSFNVPLVCLQDVFPTLLLTSSSPSHPEGVCTRHDKTSDTGEYVDSCFGLLKAMTYTIGLVMNSIISSGCLCAQKGVMVLGQCVATKKR